MGVLAGPLVGTLLAAALGGAAAAPAPALANDVPRYTANEPAIAAVKPSIVYLEQTYTGYLRDKKTGKTLHSEPVVFQRKCSGAVVDPDGHVITSSLCVQPGAEIVLVNALYKLGRTLVAEQELVSADLDSFVAGLTDTTELTGAKRGSKPGVTLFAQLNIATPGLTTAPAIRATVVRALPPREGNVALVKLDASNLPSVELDADTGISPGRSAMAIGYGEGSSEDTAGKYTIRTKSVSVTERTGTGRLGISAELGPLSRGGAVVDAEGHLLALLDTDTSTPEEPNRDLIAMLHINKLLALAGVTNRLSDADRAYRQALSAYFDGEFARAATEFDGVSRLAPSNELAKTYGDQARTRFVLAGDSVENSANWLVYVLSAVAGALIIWGLGAARQAFSPAAMTTQPDADDNDE
ncbi:serine protease [Micromonospora sp. CPCC 205371]|nr:serine protease [Micromonospora sp. CPCC 205371]